MSKLCPACSKNVSAHETKVGEVNQLCQKHTDELNGKLMQIVDQDRKWKTTDHGQYVEVVPLTDNRQHLAGDECWCNPEVERKPGSRPLISHNEVSDLAERGLEPKQGAANPPKGEANT